jgi:hypothetical protein
MGKKAAPSPTPAKEEEEEEPVVEDLGEIKEGDYVFQDGSTYTGCYLKKGDDVCLQGEGLLQNGPEMFQGLFEKGQFKEGQFKSCNGAIYVGHFHENKFHGWGEYTWNAKMPNERMYRGMWRNGYMHGCGQFLNFSFGVHKVFKGFSFRGRFSSAREEQANLKKCFLTEYCGEHKQSGGAALTALVEKTASRASGDIPAVFLVPRPPAEEGTEEKPEAVAERASIEELVAGPFPAKDVVQLAALQAFLARRSEDAEKPWNINVVEEKEQSQFLDGRLRHDQLQHVGQAIEFVTPDAEVGAIRRIVLLNVSRIFDISAAKWKLVHIEEMQAPA